MKRILVMALLASTMALVTGCDFFRRLADRPTSDEIEAKRQYIEREETLHQRRLDSLKLVQQHVSDSLAVLDSLKNSKNNMVSSQRMGALSSGTMQTRYCIVVGSFTNRDNAAKMAATVTAAGYQPLVLSYANGFTAVAICPSNTLTEVFASLKKVKTERFCPKDAWVLVKE